MAVAPGAIPIAEMTASQIFRGYVRFIGVGAIATAGIFGIIKSLRIVAGSFGIAVKAFRAGKGGTEERTDRDIPVMAILVGVIVAALAVAVFFGSLESSITVLLLGTRADAGLRVLLRVGGRQRDRHRGPQPGVGHDDADDHLLVGRPAAVRARRPDRDVLRDGHRRAWCARRSRCRARPSPTSRPATGSARRRRRSSA